MDDGEEAFWKQRSCWKYREKKKAHTTYLEEEVKKLRFVNQKLISKVQRQAIHEVEISRLRCFLLDGRGKIDNEFGTYPLKNQFTFSTNVKEGDCGMRYSRVVVGIQCRNDLTCFHPRRDSSIRGGGFDRCDKMVASSWERNCQSATVNCQATGNAIGATKISGLEFVDTSSHLDLKQSNQRPKSMYYLSLRMLKGYIIFL
ncbi:basic leucine zipper 19-like [Coffea arabica]|uniref:Basic leucine zipper 19-like n=1 Tax=Coffea arabica TaxID=13443 RepID=A0ABM4WPG2_COFAR